MQVLSVRLSVSSLVYAKNVVSEGPTDLEARLQMGMLLAERRQLRPHEAQRLDCVPAIQKCMELTPAARAQFMLPLHACEVLKYHLS